MCGLIFENNLNSLAAIYPEQAERLRGAVAEPGLSPESNESCEEYANAEIKRCWNAENELHVVDRFASGVLARRLFDHIQLESLKHERNCRLLLIEDRLDAARIAFEQEDWRTIIDSEICIIVIGQSLNHDLKKLLHRYPGISGADLIVYSSDPQNHKERLNIIKKLFSHYRERLDQYMQKMLARYSSIPRPPYAQAIRFFESGHNYLQDASVQAFRRLGYNADRLHWKNPLYRFVRSTAWIEEFKNQPFDTVFFLNSTPNRFSSHDALAQAPCQKVCWFVDNPRRYAFDRADYDGCDVIGVFDKTYIPFLQERCDAQVMEVRTGYGIDPSLARPNDEFSDIDIAFVGELGSSGFSVLEKGFAQLDSRLIDAANEILKSMDILNSLYLAPLAEDVFGRLGWDYRGSLVEFLENKAATLRRRIYLDALPDLGLVVFGGEEWKNDPAAGRLRACYGGKRIDYHKELSSLYASVKININIFHVQCVTAPNPRVYDVLASGGFLMTTDAPGLADEFELGKDLIVFRSPEELVELARYYLEHPKEREEIAMHGRRSALASCGYHDRMQNFLTSKTQSAGDGYVYLCR